VLAQTGHEIDPEALQQRVRARLSGFKVPGEVIVVDDIVRSPSGKPDYPWAQAVAKAASRDQAEAEQTD